MAYFNLLLEMKKKNIKGYDLALILGINRNTLSNKINGSSDFTITEALKIRRNVFQNEFTDDYLFQDYKKENNDGKAISKWHDG